MRGRRIVPTLVIAGLLALAAPAAGSGQVAVDTCGEGDVVAPPDPAWDLAGLDVNGVYVADGAGTVELDAIDVAFTMCGLVEDRPGATAYLLNWRVGGSDCGFRLHLSDGLTSGLTAYLQQICPLDGQAGFLLGRLVLSDRLPADLLTIADDRVTVRLPLDGVLDRFAPGHVDGTTLTDVRVTTATGVVEQDADTLKDSTFASYPFTPWDGAAGRDVTLGEDRP